MKKLLFCFLFIVFQIGFGNKIIAQDLQSFDKTKPVKVRGSLGGQTIMYNVSGIENRRKPFSFILNGNLDFTFYNIVNVPLSFTYSEQERSFQQPFNQVGMSPKYKWLTVHAGYRSLRWGEFSLAGYNFLLGGAEVQTKKLRTGFVYGRLNRATNPDTTNEQQKFILPVLKRIGYSAKIGYGNNDNFIDLIYFRAFDEGTSRIAPLGFDSIRPSENAVIDIIGKRKFAKYFSANLEIAYSSTNISREETGTKSNFLSNLILKQNNSGQSGTSFNSNINYTKNGINAEVGTRLQTLDFKSFGGYFFNTNYYSYYGRINYALFKNKLRLSHTMTIMDDNLNREKIITTKRILPQTNADIQVNKRMGIGLNYSLILTKQIIIKDTGSSVFVQNNLLNQKNHVIGIMPRYIIAKENIQHVFMIIETYQFVKDNNIFTSKYTEMSTNFINVLYSVNLPKKKLGLSISFFNTMVKNFAINVSTSGVNTGATRSFYKGKLNTGLNVSYSQNALSNTVNFTGNVNTRLAKKHNLTLYASVIKNSQGNSFSFTEYQARFMYTYSF